MAGVRLKDASLAHERRMSERANNVPTDTERMCPLFLSSFLFSRRASLSRRVREGERELDESSAGLTRREKREKEGEREKKIC